MSVKEKHLYDLDELSDYKVASGYSDVRGWEVKDKDNRVIGKVDNLLVNLDAKRVVYVDVDVDNSIIDAKYDPYTHPNNPEIREFVNKDGENHVIIPIGLVDIDDDKNYIYTDTIDHRTFAETKRYRKGDRIDRDYEVAVMDSYRRTYDDNLSEQKVREIVRDEVSDMDTVNPKEAELKNEERIRNIVKDEVRKQDRIVSETTDRHRDDVVTNLESRKDETLEERRDRLHRDDFERDTVEHTNRRDKKGLDFDHDNDDNPNITDPDYYKEKGREARTADYDHDNDGNPNITDPDYYEEKGRNAKNADYDHDNDGNPNIIDPDYYEDKLKGRETDRYANRDDEDFYDRREFDNTRWKRRRS